MRKSLLWIAAPAVLWLACLELPGFVPRVEGADAQRGYAFSSEPSQKIFSVRSWGGLAPGETEFVLWGDGRLERVSRGKAGGAVERRREIALEFVEMNDLVSIAVGGGLLEWDAEEVSIKVHQAISGDPDLGQGGRIFSPDDTPWTEVEVHLDTYVTASGEERSPMAVKFSYRWDPWLLRRMFKAGFDVPEVEALIALQESLRSRLPRERAS